MTVYPVEACGPYQREQALTSVVYLYGVDEPSPAPVPPAPYVPTEQWDFTMSPLQHWDSLGAVSTPWEILDNGWEVVSGGAQELAQPYPSSLIDNWVNSQEGDYAWLLRVCNDNAMDFFPNTFNSNNVAAGFVYSAGLADIVIYIGPFTGGFRVYVDVNIGDGAGSGTSYYTNGDVTSDNTRRHTMVVYMKDATTVACDIWDTSRTTLLQRILTTVPDTSVLIPYALGLCAWNPGGPFQYVQTSAATPLPPVPPPPPPPLPAYTHPIHPRADGLPVYTYERWIRLRCDPPFGRLSDVRFWMPDLAPSAGWTLRWGTTSTYRAPRNDRSDIARRVIPSADPGSGSPNVGPNVVIGPLTTGSDWIVIQAEWIGDSISQLQYPVIPFDIAWREE